MLRGGSSGVAVHALHEGKAAEEQRVRDGEKPRVTFYDRRGGVG